MPLASGLTLPSHVQSGGESGRFEETGFSPYSVCISDCPLEVHWKVNERRPVAWQPATQRCLPSSSLVCLPGGSYQPLPPAEIHSLSVPLPDSLGVPNIHWTDTGSWWCFLWQLSMRPQFTVFDPMFQLPRLLASLFLQNLRQQNTQFTLLKTLLSTSTHTLPMVHSPQGAPVSGPYNYKHKRIFLKWRWCTFIITSSCGGCAF